MDVRSLRRPVLAIAVLAALLVGASCATPFSPQMIRNEILRQRGEDPRQAFELTLGRFTTLLIKQALAGESGEIPFAGLAGLELAVYELAQDTGPVLDVTMIPVRGWEPLLRMHNETRSGMVLVQGNTVRSSFGERPRVADLVIVGSGSRQVVYARLWGSLDPELPGVMGDVLRDEGAEGVRSVLSRLAEADQPRRQ
jgi:hypothetical protein